MISNVMDVQIDEKIKQKILEPALYKVVFLNDDLTPMEFVIECLVGIFKHTDTTARDLTVKIHEEGSAIVGVYTFEIAEQKGIETTTLARTNGFPLQVKVEKE
tara:strand:+ start:195 stop:503 length:309 start_codon:yes stop_codon:yes gene_type:complete